MKKNLSYIFVILVLLVTWAGSVGLDNPPPIEQEIVVVDPDGNPSVGLPGGYYTVIWQNAAKDTFRLSYDGYECNIVVVAKCVSGSAVNPPPVGFKCLLEGNQKWTCGDNQELRWEYTETMQCFAYLPNTKNESPCCVTCVASYFLVDKTGKKIKDYGTQAFADTTSGTSIPVLPGKPISLVSPNELRTEIVCPNGECPPGINVIVTKPGGFTDLSSAFADCNGQFGCPVIGYSQKAETQTITYYDNGCRCQTAAKVIDPLFFIVGAAKGAINE